MVLVQQVKDSFGDTKIVVHLLVCIFAVASWVDLNGMWVELPLLVNNLPEKWTLPSYITIIGQIANIGPVLFVLVSYLAPGAKPKLEIFTSFGIIMLGLLACLLLAFFWHETSLLGGVEHSTALFILNFFLAIGDCTSTVSFYAFMNLLKPKYLASLFFGEGLSGFIPALIALGQGVGEVRCINTTNFINVTTHNTTSSTQATPQYSIEEDYLPPRFSVQVYFIILAVILGISGVAFIVLNFWSYCKTEFVEHCALDRQSIISKTKCDRHADVTYGTNGSICTNGVAVADDTYISQGDRTACDISATQLCQEDKQEVDVMNVSNSSLQNLLDRMLIIDGISRWKFFLFQLILVVINMTATSFLGTIQIYSTLPYGLQVYHLTTTLAQIANPVACIVALFYMTHSVLAISILTVVGQVFVCYIIYLASSSPNPPYVDSGGAELSILAWILVTFLLVYAKVCVIGVMRTLGRTALIWGGVSTQFGNLVGAVVGFLLVDVFELFQDASYC